MEPQGNKPGPTEALWIAKYRAAMDKIPVQQSHLEKVRAIVERAWQAVASKVGGREGAKAKGRNPNANVFAIPNPKVGEEKARQGRFKNQAAPKAS